MNTAHHRQIVTDVNNAFESGNLDRFFHHCAQDISFTMVGKPAMKGIDAVREMMSDDSWNAPAITVKTIIAEGNMAACDGTMAMSKKTGETFTGGFVDIYTFADGKIAELRSFIVPLKEA